MRHHWRCTFTVQREVQARVIVYCPGVQGIAIICNGGFDLFWEKHLYIMPQLFIHSPISKNILQFLLSLLIYLLLFVPLAVDT